MRKIRYTLCLSALLCLLCLLFSCATEPAEKALEGLVVEGWIDAGGYPVVSVTTPIAIPEGHEDMSSLYGHIVRGAQVTVSDGSRSVGLLGRPSSDNFPPYIYTTARMKGEAGKTYTLTVEYNGLKATAETTIPQITELDGIEITGSDDNYRIYASFAAEQGRYYGFFSKGEDAIGWSPAFLGLVDGDVSAGEQTVAISRATGLSFKGSYSPGFKSGEKVQLRFCTMGKAAYDYWKGFQDATGLSFILTYPKELNLPSNMDGAYGYWAGYGTVSSTLTMPSGGNSGKRSTPYYEIEETEFYTPAEFAGYAFDSGNVFWGEEFVPLVKAVGALVQAKANKLDGKMALEAGKVSAQWGFRRWKLNYPSTDALGRPVTLSEAVVAPVGIGWSHKPDKIFLNSHYTMFDNSDIPSVYADYLMGIAASDAVFICSDLEGYGASADRPHPFLVHDVLARQAVDGALAAMKLLEDEGIEFQEGYKLYNGGYSQGGSYALAVHRCIETACSAEEKALLPLEKTICGGGPYSPIATYRWYEEQEEIEYSSMLPLWVDGLKYSFPDLMAGVEVEDYFTQAFLDSGVLEMMRSKQYTGLYLMDYIKEKVGNHIGDILSEAALTHGSPQQVAMEEALRRCELTEGWKPVAPVVLYHAKDDNYVPYLNAELAVEGLGEAVTLNDLPGIVSSYSHDISGLFYYMKMLFEYF